MADLSVNRSINRTYHNGRMVLFFQADLWDRELIIRFAGGQQHVGGLYLQDEKSNEVIRYEPQHHKEMRLIEKMKQQLEKLKPEKLLIYGGIHYDDISPEELGAINAVADSFCRECLMLFGDTAKK